MTHLKSDFVPIGLTVAEI